VNSSALIQELFTDAKTYLKHEENYGKLVLAENFAQLSGYMMKRAVVLLVLAAAGSLLAISLALYLGTLLGGPHWGFLAVGGLLLLLVPLLLLFHNQLFVSPSISWITQLLFPQTGKQDFAPPASVRELERTKMLVDLQKQHAVQLVSLKAHHWEDSLSPANLAAQLGQHLGAQMREKAPESGETMGPNLLELGVPVLMGVLAGNGFFSANSPAQPAPEPVSEEENEPH